jgi:hypothetical protein
VTRISALAAGHQALRIKLRGAQELVDKLSLVFWLETVAVMVFGLAWLVKGETFLKDRVV